VDLSRGPSPLRESALDIKMKQARKNFPLDPSLPQVLDYRENSNFYKSNYQKTAAVMHSPLPPDKFREGGNFKTSQERLKARKSLNSDIQFDAYCETRGPFGDIKSNRLENFKNFKSLRRQMDKAYLLLRSTDHNFLEARSSSVVELGKMDGTRRMMREPVSVEECRE
jgi:hypothetical protein